MHSVHGVLMGIRLTTPQLAPCGVLICGEPGIGKSHAALALLDRGHVLIADDAPLFARKADNQLYGICPPSIQDCMELRGLGVINPRRLFGAQAMHTEQRLDLMIELVAASRANLSLAEASHQRLHGCWQEESILGSLIPKLVLHAQPATTMALLIETAARGFATSAYNPEVQAHP